MYWVVLACVLLVESWTEWFLVWYIRRSPLPPPPPANPRLRIPFYAYIRLLFLLYLVLPQTQGARFIYEEHIHPRLEEHETAIEEFIASAHARLRSAGIAYLKRAIELLKTNVLGLPPSPEPTAAPEPQTPQSYTQSLLARFTLPSPRWNTTLQGTTTTAPSNTTTTTPSDFYTLLTSTLSAAAATAASPTTILPESIRSAGATARVSFIQAQRERLRAVMSALDREEAAAKVLEQTSQAQDRDGGGASGGGFVSGGGFGKRRSLSEQSIGSGLSKSRSEGDFEKLDAPSGGEEMDLDEEEDGVGGGVRRRGVGGQQETLGAAAGGGRGGGWMPWGWGGGGGDVGSSSGMEK
jgi:hypothetical protein